MRRRSTLAIGPATLLALQAAHSLSPIVRARGEGGTFVFGTPDDPVRLDPAAVTDLESARITEQIYDTLLTFSGSSTEIKPGLARSWDIAPDALSYTFRLREGVKFHDGTPFDAEAVKWNFDRWGDANNPYHIEGAFEYYYDYTAFGDVIDNVEVVDASTVRINLAEPQGPFLLNLALFAFAIASPASIMAATGGNSPVPVGTGPFKFVEQVPGDRYVLDRNPEYWGDAPSLDRVIFRPIKDNAARFLALRSGSIDMFEGANPDDVTNARRDRNLTVILRPALNVGYLNMNVKQAPFDNVKVRQAVAAAINRPAIVEALFGGAGSLATQLIPPSLLGWNPEVKGPQYDQARARQLLQEANLPNGFAVDLWYMPLSRPYFPNPQAIAEAMAADLGRVGIRAALKTEDWTAYLTNRNELKYPLWMLGWTGDNGDPDNFLFTFFGNFRQDNSWDNAQVRALLKQAQVSTDSGERDQLYRQVNAIIDQEVPRIPIAHNTPPLIARSYVKGYIANPTATEYYNSVWLDK